MARQASRMSGPTPVVGRTLQPGLALRHAEAACLPLRSTHGHCRACAEACPVSALSVSVEEVALSDACIGCGRCVAACPTQALDLPEIAAARAEPRSGATSIRIECRKVPQERLAADSLVLPCTGALTVGDILAWHAAGSQVRVVDRGWCEGCEAHGGDDAEPARHPAAAAIEEAALWLGSVGAPTSPTLLAEPLPLASRPASIVPPRTTEPDPEFGRRGLLRGALRPTAPEPRRSATPMGGMGRAAYPAEARRPSPERARRIEALASLSAAAGVPLPAELFPDVTVDSRCCDQRMCVALCPTAALSVMEDQGAARLMFSSERCIACGTCVRACPDGAMHLAEHGGTAAPRTLITHARLHCVSCGDIFTPTAEDTASPGTAICPACRKAKRFMDDAARQLFGVPGDPLR